MREYPRFPWLPETLAEIAEIAGLEAALMLAAARGGTEIYIPAKLTPNHWLIETVGEEAARALCHHYASGVAIRLPLGPHGVHAELRRVVDQLIAQGLSNAVVARMVGYSERTIRRRRAQIREAGDNSPGHSGE